MYQALRQEDWNCGCFKSLPNKGLDFASQSWTDALGLAIGVCPYGEGPMAEAPEWDEALVSE